MLPNKGDRNRRNYVATTSERPKLTTETLILVCNKDHNFFNFQKLFKFKFPSQTRFQLNNIFNGKSDCSGLTTIYNINFLHVKYKLELSAIEY